MTQRIGFATRKSLLALTQTRWVMAHLSAAGGYACDEVQVVTEGDRVQERPLYEIGGKGLFVTEVEQAIVDGRATFAVHSMKDLPAVLAAGLAIVAIPRRESAWDLLVTREGIALEELPHGARIGTTSLRRKLQLQAQRPDVQCVTLRGNVDTRLARLSAGDFDAIVLAEAGIRRLGMDIRAVRLSETMVPSIGQGVLAIEGHATLAESDPVLARVLAASLEHGDTRVCAEAERSVQRALGADCVTPLGAHATLSEDGAQMCLVGWLARPDGSRSVRASVEGARGEGARLGSALAAELRGGLAG
ncbi:MAG: hydroxymethylbilane synthase [Deltaproteobacteria bacterium]|nr:hydroxymethylbilane synthase [Deltaproteobacteria bacterium]